jgi:hypothetical protein
MSNATASFYEFTRGAEKSESETERWWANAIAAKIEKCGNFARNK